MTIMNEIVGPSGEQTGGGCLMALAEVLAVIAMVTAVPIAVLTWAGVL